MTNQKPVVGVLLHGSTAPDQIVPLARLVEDGGFDEVWLSEDYFFLGGISTAGMVLEATDEIPVGIGILAGSVRHPAVTAMEIATLANAYPDRLITGIGHGVPFWTAQMGLTSKSPLKLMRNTINSVRRLLEGETVSEDTGRFLFDEVTLTHPAAGTPLLVGVIGPKSLELAGEVADGTVVSVLAGPKYIEYAKQKIEIGAKKSGREGLPHALPTFVLYSVDLNSTKARDVAREAIAFYLQAVGPTPLTGVYGYNEELVALLDGRPLEELARALPEEWIDNLAIAGTPSECVERIQALLDAGSTSVVLAPFPPDDAQRMISVTAESVLPHLS